MMDNERRKYKRVPVDFPVFYRIQKMGVMGKAVNVCSKGVMVESYLALETASRIVTALAGEDGGWADLQFIYKDKTYRPEAQIRHFHLDFSGKQPCRAVAGFSLLKKGSRS